MSEKFMAGAAVQPRQDMPEPYILWDTRSWDGSLGVGTGGIPNEGTAGSSFDLDVTQRDVGYWAYFAKQGPAAESASWVTTSVDWDAVGGVPCDGPITIMMAFGDFPRRRTSGVHSGFPNAAAYGLQYFRGTSGWHWLPGGEWYNNDNGDMSGYLGASVNADAPDYKYAEVGGDSNPGDDVAIQEQLIVLTHDIADGGATFWRWPDPCPAEIQFVPPPGGFLSPFNFEVFDQSEPCSAGAANNGSILGGSNEQFCFIGEHRSYAPLVPGQAWNGLIGIAFFRGEPTRAQIQYWHDYFLDGYTPTVTPLAYDPTGFQAIRVDGTHVYYIHTNFGTQALTPLAGKPLPATVDVFLAGGGGRGDDRDPGDGATGGGAGGEAFVTLGLTAPTSPINLLVGEGGTAVTFDGGDSVYDVGGLDLTASGGTGGTPLAGVGGSNASFAGGGKIEPAGGGGAGAAGAGQSAPSSTQGGDGGPGVLNDWRIGTNIEYGRGAGGGGRAPFALPNVSPGNPWDFPEAWTGSGGRPRTENFISPSNGARGIVIVRHLRMD